MKGSKGFSIIEVLIGISIFSLGFMGVILLMVSSIKGSSFAGNLTEATFLATSQLEQAMSADYDNDTTLLGDKDGDGDQATEDTLPAPYGDGVDNNVTGPDNGENFGLDDYDCGPAGACNIAGKADGIALNQGRGGNYTVYWNIADNLPIPDSKTINVIVTWVVKDEERRISMSTVKIKNT